MSMKLSWNLGAGAIAVAVVLAGCQGKTPPGGAASGGEVVAEVNRTKITLDEFNKEVEKVPPMIRPMFNTEKGRKDFLDDLILREVVLQEARKQGLEQDADYQRKVADFKRGALLEMVLRREVEEKTKVGDEDVKKHFESHRAEFKTGEEVRASHILVKTEEEARKAQERLAQGADFGSVAKELSLDPGSKGKGGDLGFFSRGQMVPEFEAAAFSLAAGKVSSPVKTQFGYHLIKVTKKKEGKPQEYEEVAPHLRQRLLREKQKAAFDSWVAGLKTAAKITVHETVLAKGTEKGPNEASAGAGPAGKGAPDKAAEGKKGSTDKPAGK